MAGRRAANAYIEREEEKCFPPSPPRPTVQQLQLQNECASIDQLQFNFLPQQEGRGRSCLAKGGRARGERKEHKKNTRTK